MSILRAYLKQSLILALTFALFTTSALAQSPSNKASSTDKGIATAQEPRSGSPENKAPAAEPNAGSAENKVALRSPRPISLRETT